jgi:nucleoside-diphosphate-sugar epimerase
MRILVTGASGVLGRVIVPLLDERGNQLAMPSSFQQGSNLTLEQQPARMRG